MLYSEGDSTHYGMLLERCRAKACWDRVVARAELEERVERAADHNLRHRYKTRGIAVVPTKFGISFTTR